MICCWFGPSFLGKVLEFYMSYIDLYCLMFAKSIPDTLEYLIRVVLKNRWPLPKVKGCLFVPPGLYGERVS